MCKSQNLIPNPSFEQFTTCPFELDRLNFCSPWYNVTNATPDAYNQCSNGGNSVPISGFGYQAARTGVGYAAILTYTGNLGLGGWREYIGIKLNSTLKKDSSYLFEMYVNLSDTVYHNSPNVGVYFTKNKLLNTAITGPIIRSAQINNSLTNTFDTVLWTRVHGTYTAKGGESYLTIGNFIPDDQLTLTLNNLNPIDNDEEVYIYIDDVSLTGIPDCNVLAFPNIVTGFNNPKRIFAQGGEKYKWTILPINQQTIFLDNDTLINPLIQFNQNATQKSGKFKAVVEMRRGVDCIDTDTVDITITDGSYFFIPNAFSPNNDGLNDQLTVFNYGNDFEFIRIFNRWGNLVFESNSTDNKWDGNFKGKKASSDTYFWVARIRDKIGIRITKKGTVTVVR